MNTAYIFIVNDGIISRLDMSFDISKEHVANLKPEMPYCDIVNDYGNPVARAYREREHTLKRGTYGTQPSTEICAFDVLVVDADKDPEDYLFMGYINGEIVPNPFMSEAERMEEALRSMSFHPLPFGFDHTQYVFWNTMKYAEIKDYMTEEHFKWTVAKIRAQEAFTSTEVASQIAMCNRMPQELAMRMRYGFGMGEQMRARSDFSSQTTQDLLNDPSEYRTGPFKRHPMEKQIEISNNALMWFDMLRGTRLEKVILSHKASLLSVTQREDDAVDLYRDMLNRLDLTEKERQLIYTKIYYLGYGRRLFNVARKQLKDGRYSDVIETLNKFLCEATGDVKLSLQPQAMTMLNQCKMILKRR